jgi:hypothetical protein
VFFEALPETSETDDGGLFALVVYQLTGAIDITETDAGEVRIDATALVEGALEAMAVLGGAWSAERGVTLQVAGRYFLDALRATEQAGRRLATASRGAQNAE